MMIDLMWALYWIDVLSGVAGALFVAVVVSVMAAFVNLITYDELGRFLFRRMSFAIIFAACIAANFIPSKQTMYIMLGLKTTDVALQSQMGKKLTTVIEKEIDGWISKKDKK